MRPHSKAAVTRNILLEDFGKGGLAVQANQHLIVHDGEGMILDPGGHKIYGKVLGATRRQAGSARPAQATMFLSHQDPDIVAATNGWLMTTDADRVHLPAVGSLRAALRPRPLGG
jgi:flavorubredoxin